jgi:hypothetical protein
VSIEEALEADHTAEKEDDRIVDSSALQIKHFINYSKISGNMPVRIVPHLRGVVYLTELCSCLLTSPLSMLSFCQTSPVWENSRV